MMNDKQPITFSRVVLFCWQNEDFMREYRRLTGHRLGLAAVGIDAMIDSAAGRPIIDPREAKQFFQFIRDKVWLPVLSSVAASSTKEGP